MFLDIILVILCVVVVWSVISFVWFWKHLGMKYREDKWYDFIMAPPVLILAFIVGYITKD